MLSRCGLASLLGLPEDCNTAEYHEIFDYNSGRSLEPMTLLSSLFKEQAHIDTFHKRCKLSNAEKSLAEFFVKMRDEARANIDSMKYFKDMILDLEKAPGHNRKKMGGREMVVELAKYIRASPQFIEEIGSWEMPEFPVNGKDLMGTGVKGGPVMRKVLTHLFEVWKRSDYKIDRDELLSHVTAELLQLTEDHSVGRCKKRKATVRPIRRWKRSERAGETKVGE